MVPKNRLGRAQMDKLFVYAGPNTPTRPNSPSVLTPRRFAAVKERRDHTPHSDHRPT